MADADVWSALANPIRREILLQLRRGPRGVTELAERFHVGRPAVSEHLAVLKKHRLVREEPRGRERYYHLDPRPLSAMSRFLDAFGKYWEPRLDALGALLDEQRRQEQERR